MSIEDSKSPPNQIPLSFAIAFSWVHNSPAKTTSSSLTHNSMGHVIKLSQVDVSRNDGHPFYVTNFKANVLFGFLPFSIPHYGTQTWQCPSHFGQTDEENVLGWEELEGRKLTS